MAPTTENAPPVDGRTGRGSEHTGERAQRKYTAPSACAHKSNPDRLAMPAGQAGDLAFERIQTSDADRRRLERATHHLVAEAMRYVSPEDLARSFSKQTAAAHEAGHVIAFAGAGIPLRRATIRRDRAPLPAGLPIPPGGIWTGDTWEASDWFLHPKMGAEAYLSRARVTLAGLLGEEAAGRAVPGSSADEVVLALNLAGGAAQLTGAAPRALFLEVVARTTDLIHRDRDIHRRIARALERSRRLDGPTLRRMTAGGRP